MADSGSVLEARDLSIAFRSAGRELVAVDGASFRLAEGETLGIVGESGSGKTAMALSLLRLLPEPPAKILGGQVIFHGDNLLDLSDKQLDRVRGRNIAMIFQEPVSSLNPVLSVRRQLIEPLQLHLGLDRRAAEARALRLLDRVRIPAAARRLDSYPHELSGGLRQRVMIAMAISCDPQVLIADEPTTALDVTVQAQILDLLRDIQVENRMSVLIITHDLGVIADFVERVAVMYAGRIVEHAPVSQFFDRPLHPYTQALIASMPDPLRRTRRLATIPGQVPKLAQMPSGCRFAPRCDKARPPCLSLSPPLFPAGADRAVACIEPFGYQAPPA